MERFCDRCGSLVSGNGKFCPLCGAKMGFELNISSDLDIDTSSSFLDELDTSLPDIGDTKPTDNAVSSTSVTRTVSAVPNNDVNVNYSAQRNVPQGYVPQYIPRQSHEQPYQSYGAAPQNDTEKLTMGRWVGTLLLSTCLGIVSYILLIVWGFGGAEKEPKKSFARAMLILLPIVHFVSFFGTGLLFYLIDS